MSANTLLTSIVTGGSNSHATTAEEANAWATDFVGAGVVGSIGLNSGSAGTGSFCVNADASPDMGVTILSGQAYITATPSGQNSQVLRVRASTSYTTYTINANASGSTKYDWIYLSVSATNANTPSSDGSNVASFVTSRSSSNSTDNGSPPTYGILLAVVTVANGASSITNSNISDRRTVASLSVAGSTTSTGWVAGLTVPTTVTANGNRSYFLVFNSTDITGTVSAGMRLKTTRAVAAPTQCTSLNGTTQYYSKTSPAGMTFTDDFTVSAWIKVSSYAAGAISSRYNGTSGWLFRMESTGQISLFGFNAGASNFRQVTSYQSVPLNKWVHVAAQFDMVTHTNAATTNYIMIDGVDVPAALTTSGSNPTTLIQAGNLEIGSTNGGTTFFPGKIAQVAIYSAKVTQANIQATISQGLAGTETSLISAYSFNNSINDLNANANNLTANGSAVATATDSPFGGQADGTISSTLDYGIITKAAFSTNTTLTVQVPEGCTIPTSGGVSAVSYSTQKAPYLFPAQRGKWRISAEYKIQQSTGLNITTGQLTGGLITVPIGSWKIAHGGFYQVTSGGITNMSVNIGLSTATGSLSSDLLGTIAVTPNISSSQTESDVSLYRPQDYDVSAQTPVYLVSKTTQNVAVLYNGTVTPAILEAELATL